MLHLSQVQQKYELIQIHFREEKNLSSKNVLKRASLAVYPNL